MMAFENLTQLLEQAQTEQTELEAATVALDAAKAELTTAQEVVASKQAAVDAARGTATTEKQDVINVLQQMQTAIAALLAELA